MSDAPQTKEEREAKWWADWWAQDFSWDGLAKHKIADLDEGGKCTGGQFGEQTLQDYWRWSDTVSEGFAPHPGNVPGEGRYRSDEELLAAGELVTGADGRTWHIAHLPPRWTHAPGWPFEGQEEASWKADLEHSHWPTLNTLIAQRIRRAAESEAKYGRDGTKWRIIVTGPDARARLDGACLLGAPSHPDGEDAVISLSCDHVAFLGQSDCGKNSYAAGTDFTSASFAGDANFSTVLFGGDASFEGKTILTTLPVDQRVQLSASGSDQFAGSIREEEQSLPLARRVFVNCNFKNAVFLGEARFDNRDILSSASFEGVAFYGLMRFHGCRLNQGLEFLDAIFRHGLTPDADWPAKAVEARLRDHHDARQKMKDRNASKLTNEAWTQIWEKERDKWKARFEKNRPKSDSPSRNAYFARLEACYRTLKLYMENVQRNRIEEGRFFRLELLARRERADIPKWERRASRWYERLSDFGNSIWRPFWWSMSVSSALTPFYWLLGALGDGQGFGLLSRLSPMLGSAKGTYVLDDDVWRSVAFSFSNMFPFGAFGEMREAFLSDISPGWKLTIVSLATLQSLLSLALIFLIGLALRRRFQIS